MGLTTTDPRRNSGLPVEAGRRDNRFRRHSELGWTEWTFRELFRYLFGVGVLALVVFVPLQMDQSWLPSGSPALVPPWIVVLLALLAVCGIGALALIGYRALGGPGGWVHRHLAGRSTGLTDSDNALLGR